MLRERNVSVSIIRKAVQIEEKNILKTVKKRKKEKAL